ncbi:MAG: signal peptidase [Verrucomicrobiota bacterium]
MLGGRQLNTPVTMNTSLPNHAARSFWGEGSMNSLKMAEGDAMPYHSDRFLTEPAVVRTAARVRAAAPARASRVGVLLGILLLAVVAHFVVSRLIVMPVVIQGRSMSPTLRDGEYRLLQRWVYLFRAPDRGELVVLRDPGHADLAVKRIIAKPGDWVNLRDGKVFLNGHRLNEPYLNRGTMTFPPDGRERWVQLGRNQYYVMGDNRPCSEDSRAYGSIVEGNILGTISL